MCGIACVICAPSAAHELPDAFGEQDKRLWRRRGPHQQGHWLNSVANGEFSAEFRLFASVLRLQGTAGSAEAGAQPYEDARGNVLLWNGEIYDVAPESRASLLLLRQGWTTTCDTALVAALLQRCSSAKEAAEALGGLRAEYAFIYFSKGAQQLWFARDGVGRRSLVFRRRGEEGDLGGETLLGRHSGLKLASAMGEEPGEDGGRSWGPVHVVPAAGVYAIQVAGEQQDLLVTRAQWPAATKALVNMVRPRLRKDGTGAEAEHRRRFARALRRAVRRRLRSWTLPRPLHRDVPRVAVLFSGGLDCSVVAALAHEALPLEEPIDLLNVCFDAPQFASPDRQGAVAGLMALHRIAPERDWRLLLVDAAYEEAVTGERAEQLRSLLLPARSHMDFNLGVALWFASRAEGRVVVPEDIQLLQLAETQAGVGEGQAPLELESEVSRCWPSRVPPDVGLPY
eukprot:scaffold623_cov235-Pinguiococcus_pyrenoidosus.AAC.1